MTLHYIIQKDGARDLVLPLDLDPCNMLALYKYGGGRPGSSGHV